MLSFQAVLEALQRFFADGSLDPFHRWTPIFLTGFGVKKRADGGALIRQGWWLQSKARERRKAACASGELAGAVGGQQ